jgi:hypothetical protein
LLNVASLGGMAVGLPAGQELDLERLVNDLACGLRPPAEVWREHGIVDREVAQRILSLDVVQEMLKEARAAWHSAGNAKSRVKMRSALAVENLLLPLVLAAKNPAYPLNHRTDTVKFLAKLGGFEVDGASGGGGKGGGDGVQVTISIDLTDPQGRGEGGMKTVTEVRSVASRIRHDDMVDDEDEIGNEIGDGADDPEDFIDITPDDVIAVGEEDEELLVSLPLRGDEGLPEWAPELSAEDRGE